jgi:hypothetical protein
LEADIVLSKIDNVIQNNVENFSGHKGLAGIFVGNSSNRF